MSEKSDSGERVCAPQPTIRFLLPAVDGLFPFLTPQLLRRCFPATEELSNRLWIGIAVKDTCVVPVFAEDTDPKTSKPRGYHFTSDPTSTGGAGVDSWMKAYTRVTVPTFDMLADAKGRQNANNAAVVATDQHVMLWTGNGRQSITAAQYYGCARGLDSHYTVPLFDSGCGSTKKRRRVAALRRTQEWNADYRQRLATDDKPTLSPILVDEDIMKEERGLESQLERILGDNDDKSSTSTKSPNKGVALIGWSSLPAHLQDTSMQQIARSLANRAPLGLLATDSLAQVLRAACHGATLIGSSLPQQWAVSRRAFLFDLDDECLRGQQEHSNPEVSSEPSAKRAKTEDTSPDALALRLDQDGCLNLNPNHDDKIQDHPWYRDKRPLLPECTCHTCQTHSRAYLYHLVCAKEMLSEILLFIHNLHHMLHTLKLVETADKSKREALLACLVAKTSTGESSS